MNVAIVFAGGSGQRMLPRGKPKQFLELYGKPIIVFTLEVFQRHRDVDAIIVPVIAGWEDHLRMLVDDYGLTKVVNIVRGGATTQDSKLIALRSLEGVCRDDDIVILHDAVRPLITPELVSATIESVREHGSAVSFVPFSETGIVSSDGRTVDDTILRNTLFVAKAPQSFYYRDARDAHERGLHMDPAITIDTCSLMLALGRRVHLVPCDASNIKITTPDDFFVFKALVDLRESREIFGLL